MSDTFTVLTIGIVANKEGKLLITKRSSKEANAAGVFSYPGGKAEYTQDEDIDVLEKNLQREIKEETRIVVNNLRYINSHTFMKQSGEKVMAIAYLCNYESGEAKPMQTDEILEVAWMNIAQIEKLDTYPIIKKIYRAGYNKFAAGNDLHHVDIAALVINDNMEFLLLKKGDMYEFPSGPVVFQNESSWEMLESAVIKTVKEQTGQDISEAPIPFTDQAFMDKDHFDKITQFFICRSTGNQELPQNSIWLSFEKFDKSSFTQNSYTVFSKAHQFIQNLAR